MGHTRRRGMERNLAGDRRGDAHGPIRGMPGNEPVEFGASPGTSEDVGGTRDWRLGLMHELRVFMAFVMACEAGIAPSRRQRAGCVHRLDSLSAALREPPRRSNGRYEAGQRVGSTLTGGSEGVALRPREIEALGLRRMGLLPKEIAREMGVTLLTVRSYIRDAAGKLDVSGWEAAVRRAIELELL